MSKTTVNFGIFVIALKETDQKISEKYKKYFLNIILCFLRIKECEKLKHFLRITFYFLSGEPKYKY